MMSYKQVDTVTELMDRATVRASSFSGKLIATDISRKWTIWQIKSPYADFVTRPNGTHPLFLGNSDMTGKVYQLTEGSTNDDGQPINQDYVCSPFISAELAQALQLGNTRKLFAYLVATLGGNGKLGITVYPESLETAYPNTLIPLTLPTSAGFDTEIPLNETGNRLFIEFSMNGASGAGTGFDLSRIVMALRTDNFIPVRGRN
jgi:hypothetical protein